jgi:hypothetical protein
MLGRDRISRVNSKQSAVSSQQSPFGSWQSALNRLIQKLICGNQRELAGNLFAICGICNLLTFHSILLLSSLVLHENAPYEIDIYFPVADFILCAPGSASDTS